MQRCEHCKGHHPFHNVTGETLLETGSNTCCLCSASLAHVLCSAYDIHANDIHTNIRHHFLKESLGMFNGKLLTSDGVILSSFQINTRELFHPFGRFKFALKPTYNMVHCIFSLANWDTSFWNFFCQIWTQGTLRYILGLFLVIFEICQFMKIPGLFEYFSKNKPF